MGQIICPISRNIRKHPRSAFKHPPVNPFPFEETIIKMAKTTIIDRRSKRQNRHPWYRPSVTRNGVNSNINWRREKALIPNWCRQQQQQQQRVRHHNITIQASFNDSIPVLAVPNPQNPLSRHNHKYRHRPDLPPDASCRDSVWL